MSLKNNLLSEQLVYTGNSSTATHLHLCTYDAAGVKEIVSDSFADIQEAIDPSRINWLQVHGLQNTDTISRLCNHFQIDFLVTQDILNVMHPTKIEEHDNYMVIILKIFKRKPDDAIDTDLDSLQQQQVCLVLGTHFVLTFMERESSFFDEVDIALKNDVMKIRSRETDYLLSVLLNSVVANYAVTVAAIDDDLEDLEEELLTIRGGHDIGVRIQTLRRQYMILKKAIQPLKEQYIKLPRTDHILTHEANRPFFNDVNDHLQFVLQTIDVCRETLSSLVDLYISNNDLHMNDIMKRLTVVSTIFIPLTFLVGVWGMNFKNMPELDWRYGYLLAWVVMMVIGFMVWLFFKRKRWY
ncbi:MAG: magnesium/cobalt transporter CorA [Prevotellaceae bacterium]|jgi:magnesium transporter|nr:magnesium/cobalt transporter CorA [Prevotellaceae bacterium]